MLPNKCCWWCSAMLLLLLLLLLPVKPSVELTELVELSVDKLDTVLKPFAIMEESVLDKPTTMVSACSKGRSELRISASSFALGMKESQLHLQLNILAR